MNRKSEHHKQRLRGELLAHLDQRNARWQRRRRLQPRLAAVACAGAVIIVFGPAPPVGRTPVRTTWIPAVTLEHLVESRRVAFVSGEDRVLRSPEAVAASLVPDNARTIERCSTSDRAKRISESEAAELWAMIETQS